VHGYVSGLTSTPKTELFCSCKRRKFIGQNKVKIFKLLSQNFKFLGQKLVAVVMSILLMSKMPQNYAVIIQYSAYRLPNSFACLKKSIAAAYFKLGSFTT